MHVVRFLLGRLLLFSSIIRFLIPHVLESSIFPCRLYFPCTLHFQCSTMKRNHEEMSQTRPRNASEVKVWLQRVQLFEEVNWESPLPDYTAVKNLAMASFDWDWSPACSVAYNSIIQATGILHGHGLLQFPPSHPSSEDGVGAPTAPCEDHASDSSDAVCSSSVSSDEDSGCAWSN